MVQFGYESDEEDQFNGSLQQKFQLRKPITPYVSSTPCDFDLERNYLATEIFPKLHEICRHRGTAFNPIDIQWSPDSIQTESGHLLQINLDFISKCSPFFLCLLGETYGPHRAPEEKRLPDSLKNLPEDCSWLDKSYLVAASAGYKWILKEMHQNCSVPELEIIQAAFLTDNRYCHFYYRQPEHLDNLFQGLSQAEKDIKSKPYKPVSEYADLSIRDLKQRIVNKGLPVKYFQTKEELGQHVLTDWLEIINSLYPPLLDGPALYDTEEFREWLHHEVFAESRRQVYLTYPELNTIKDELTEFCMGVLDEPVLEVEESYNQYKSYHSSSSVLRKQPEVIVRQKSLMVVKGDRGSGKSALLANWIKQFSQDNQEIKVITHFVGSSGRSRDVVTFMRLCISELREHFLKDEHSIGPDLEDVSQNFKALSGCFQAAIGLGPCLLILDGVDELSDSLGISPQEVKKFQWLPLPLPPQCCVILTTIPSDLSHSNLSSRPDVKFLTLTHLNTTKLKAEFLEDSMNMYYDHLKKPHLHTLFESRLSGKPLFLKIVGTEMSSYSVYTDLEVYTEMVREMCTSIRDLYVRCIKRWSHDHSWTYEVLSSEQMESENVEYIGWVADILRLIAVSRSGLTANEILEILEMIGYQENVKVTQFDWLMFRQCMGDNITESPYGVVNFSHQHMREVVEYVLLRTVKPSTAEIISVSEIDKEWKKQKSEFHQNLVEYFTKQPHSQRKTEELPWQQLMCADVQGLKASLADPELFLSLYDEAGKNPSNYYDLKMYWYYLEKDGHNPTTHYIHLLQKINMVEPDPEPMEVQSLDGSSEGTPEGKLSSRQSLAQETVISPVIPTINIPRYTTDSPHHKLSVIEEASDILSTKDEKMTGEDRATSPVDSVFVTQSNSQFEEEADKLDLTDSQMTTLTWYISQFLLNLGHLPVVERILNALHTWLLKRYPLSEDDQLTQAKVQECLGQLYLDTSNLDLAERWYKKALRTVMDMFDTEETSPIYTELQILKCKVIHQIGYLRLQEGLLDDADDLLQEAIELAEVIHKIPVRASVLFHIGNLRHKQEDYLMAETNLRKCLMLRQKWYGKSHPLVADTLFALGIVMADEGNERGYDRMASQDVFRKCLDVREFHLEKDHLKIAEVLFQIGKLLKSDRSYGGKAECQKVLERALDIRITRLGGDHIETRAVRQYINNLETSLKAAKYDVRSSERPYSSLSWRGNDLANLEKKSRITSAKSSSYGQTSRPGSLISRTGSHRSRPGSHSFSRPVSGLQDQLPSYRSNLSHLSASERIAVEASKPSRLLQRESVDRKLKQKGAVSPNQLSPTVKEPVGEDTRRQINIEISTGMNEEEQDTKMSGVLLDSFGYESDRTAVKFRASPVEKTHPEGVVIGRETPPQRLYRRFGSPQGSEHLKNSNEGTVLRVGEMTFVRSSESLTPSRKDTSVKHKRPAGSARSVGSSLYTTMSATSMGSTKSHKSSCDIPTGPHSIHLSNTRTITMGPHSSIKSLMGYQGPKDISKGIHHKSAWYHVPGRYGTVDKKVAPKRSQKRREAKDLKKHIQRTEPDPYMSFMKSDYRKNNPRHVKHCGHISSNEINYPPYPRDNRKQYIICEKCQREAEEIVAARERELIGLVDGSLENLQLEPTVNPIMTPDRPKQVTYVVEEPMTQEELDYGRTHTTVKFQDPVIVN